MWNNESLLKQPAKLGGILGIAFLVLFFVSILGVQGEGVAIDDPIEEIRAYFVDDGEQYLLGDYLTGIALLFLLLPYTICLRIILARAEGEPGIFSQLYFAAVILAISFGAASAIGWGTASLAAGDERVDDSSIQLMMYVAQYGESGLLAGFALIALAASIVMLMTSVPARWLGYLGLATFALCIIGAAWVIDGDPEGALATVGLLGLLVFAIWNLCISIVLLRMGEPATVTTEAPVV
jgi:hypothetical protein